MRLRPGRTRGAQCQRCGGDPGVHLSSALPCAADLDQSSVCRDGAVVSSGKQACPCASVPAGPVVRSVSAVEGTQVYTCHQHRRALLVWTRAAFAGMVLLCLHLGFRV